MSITVACPKCGKAIKAPDDAAGKKGKCRACGTVIEIPAGAAGGAAPGASGDDPMAALAQALGAAAATGGGPPSSPAEALAGDLASAGALKPVEKPIRPQPVSPAAVQAVAAQPAPAEPAAAESPPTGATPMVPVAAPPSGDSDMIAVPPIGVQTPSGLPARPRAAGFSHPWQRRLAGYVRICSLALGGLSVLAGIGAMLLMVRRNSDYLWPGIGLFVIMLVVGAMSALGGLLLRHMLLLLADLGEGVRAIEDLLDRINDRLG